jgi:hypothetical protein
VEEITRLVVQREQARLQKDFTLADEFRNRLGNLGVRLDDKASSWKSADGRTGRIPSFTEVENGAGDPDAVVDALLHSGGQAPVYSNDSEEGQIKNLVRQREEARSAKEFGRSDQIRDELKAMGVDVFDKDKIWKSKDGLCGVVIGYSAGSGGGPCPTDTEITTLVQQREKARANSDWDMADMIRNELKQWGVDIFDKDKVWRTSDGRSGGVPQWKNLGVQCQKPQPMGYPMPPPVPQVNLDQLFAACAANARNPATSARTIALLQEAAAPPTRQHYGAPPPQYYAAPPPQYNVPPPRQSSSGHSRTDSRSVNDALKFCTDHKADYTEYDDIMWLLGVREKLRRDKDYAGADKLRDAYRANLGLELQEKEKAWSMSDGRRGEIPPWDSLA